MDDLLQRFLTLKHIAAEIRLALSQLDDAGDHVSSSVTSLSTQAGAVMNSLRSWAATGRLVQDILDRVCIQHDDAELCCSWAFISKRIDLMSAVNDAISHGQWNQYGAAVSTSATPELVPAGNAYKGVTYAALTKIVFSRCPLKLSLLGDDYDLTLQIPLTFRLTDNRTVVIERAGHAKIIADVFWKVESSPAIASQMCLLVEQSLDSHLSGSSKSSRYAFDLGEPFRSSISQERDNLVATVLAVTPDQFLRVSFRIWKKVLAYRIGDPSWRPNPPDSATANPGIHLVSTPNPRLSEIPGWADITLKVNGQRIGETLWEYIHLRANAAYWSSKGEYVDSPWKNWGIAADPYDANRVKLYWNHVYTKLFMRCVSGAWRWYDWQLHYECDQWAPGETRLPVTVYAGFGVVPTGLKNGLIVSVSALGKVFQQNAIGIDGQRVETVGADPFLLVHVST